MDYQLLTADQLLAALQEAGRAPDLDLIRACLERREELTPGLLEMLAASDNESWLDDDPRWHTTIHAGLLLIAFREPAALPIFAEIFRDEEREHLIEWFDTELPAYGPAATQMAIDLFNDAGAHEYARSSAAGVLAAIGWQYPKEQERILPTLRAHLPPLAKDGELALPGDILIEPDPLWTWVVSALADLRDKASQPQVIALYEQGLIDEFILGDLNVYLAYFEPGASPPRSASHSFDIIKIYEWLHRQAAQEATQKAEMEILAKQRAAKPDKSRSPEPYTQSHIPGAEGAPFVHSQPQVGRNEPCPCGSGKKYKHCHGKRKSE